MKLKEIITRNWLFFLILVLASVLRLWSLNHYPSGLNADETAIGYNAYSLLKTGLDEHGNPWPVHFKSFGDYKPGFYFYLVLPFVKILGLNAWAVRLPSAILGILSVFLVYVLAKELFRNKRLALFSAFFLAISPWHLHFSRGGWESNAATFFIVLAVCLFFKGLEKPKFFLFSILAFILSLYTYHSARLVAPFLGLGLLGFYFRDVFTLKNRRWLLTSALVAVLVLIPLLVSFFRGGGTSRFSGVGLLSDTGPLWRANELRSQHANPHALSVRLIHNKYFRYSIAFFENWLSHYEGHFLFIFGDEVLRSRIPGMGQMHLFAILLLPAGIYFLLKNRPRNWRFVFFWLAIAPVASALTFQSPSALRAHNMVIPLVLLSSCGFYQICLLVKTQTKFLVFVFYVLAGLILVWSVTYYLHQYYIHYPKAYPEAWEFGFKELVEKIEPELDDFDEIYVTDKYDQPYILFAFFLKYPPEKLQSEIKLTPRDKFGFSTVKSFGKFHFEEINWDKLKDKEYTMIIASDEKLESSAKIQVEEIYYQRSIFKKNASKVSGPIFRIVRLYERQEN